MCSCHRSYANENNKALAHKNRVQSAGYGQTAFKPHGETHLPEHMRKEEDGVKYCSAACDAGCASQSGCIHKNYGTVKTKFTEHEKLWLQRSWKQAWDSGMAAKYNCADRRLVGD